MNFEIKTASPDDAAALVEIYAPYVTGTAITFEYDVPSVEEFEKRIENTLKAYPYLKAVGETGEIIGYAYAGRFRARKAYDYTAEVSVYVRCDLHACGIGRALYTELEKELEARGMHSLIAVLSVTEHEDEHLTNGSLHFHEAMGYRKAAHFHEIGYKFGKWYDMVWLEKLINTSAESEK